MGDSKVKPGEEGARVPFGEFFSRFFSPLLSPPPPPPPFFVSPVFIYIFSDRFFFFTLGESETFRRAQPRKQFESETCLICLERRKRGGGNNNTTIARWTPARRPICLLHTFGDINNNNLLAHGVGKLGTIRSKITFDLRLKVSPRPDTRHDEVSRPEIIALLLP